MFILYCIIYTNREPPTGKKRSLSSLLFKNLHPVRIFFDPRDKGFLDLIALAACHAEDEFIQRGSAQDVDVVTCHC